MLKLIFQKGSDIVVIDDNSADRGDITNCWLKPRVLLRTFHSLRQQWTWLYEDKNIINEDDRVTLI